MTSNLRHCFLGLIRAGLWEKEARLSQYGKVDYGKIMRLAEEQSVDGLVTAGLEHVADAKAPQEVLLQFIGTSLQLEQRNTAMNKFIAEMIEKMREEGIYTLLVKGQGIAQCYERPLWRVSGDVDLLLSDDNYKKAREFLLPLSSDNKREERYSQHLGMSLDPWYVEIHGSMRTGLSGRVDRVIDEAQRNVFYGGSVRSWTNGKTQVFMPGADEDVFFVFTHFIKHFYKEGLGLRQVCDWCRLLFCYREKLDLRVLESRINRTGLMGEWRAFAALAVDYLGMPMEAMPLYDVRCKKDDVRAKKLIKFILSGYSGNVVRDTWTIAKIFPWNTIRFAPAIFLNVNWLKVRERLFGNRKL